MESANEEGITIASSEAGLDLQSYGNNYVRYYGAIGGDVSINSGLNGSLKLFESELLKGTAQKTEIVRENGYTNVINGGSVIGGIGGSVAAALGNINADVKYSYEIVPGFNYEVVSGSVSFNGETSTTVNGAVTTNVAKDANLIGFMNGGLAAGLGGTATSTISGDSILTITGTGRDVLGGADEKPGEEDFLPELTTAINVMKGSKVNAIGVLGGGTAMTTLDGSAQANVNGTSTININGATVIGAIGGGAAASIDATDVGDVLAGKLDPGHPHIGNPEGVSDFDIGMNVQQKTDAGYPLYKNKNGDTQYYKKDGQFYTLDNKEADVAEDSLDPVTGIGLLTGDYAETDVLLHGSISQVHTGGKATSITGDTIININGNKKIDGKEVGNSTVIGVLGGGVAAATQTYYDRNDGKDSHDIYGSSQASATTGKATINIDMTNKLSEEDKSDFMKALGAFKDGLAPNEDGKPETFMQADVLAPIANKGAVGAVFGGGASLAYGSIETAYDPESHATVGAEAKSKTNGADINLANGYAAGIMGGGIAGVRGNAYAESSMKDTVNINIGGFTNTLSAESAEAVGVFGNGLAYYTGSNGAENDLTGQAVVTAENTNINVAGMADGLIGGGMAIDDSEADTVNATVQTSGTAAINVYEGAQVNKVGIEALDGLVGNVPTDSIDMGSYVDGVKAAAGNAAIAAGGIALGGGANAEVANAEVNIIGGTVTGDVYGGGIAAYGYGENNGGSTVETSTINLIGGKVDGNVYAGGAVATKTSTGADVYSSYDKATATVGKAVTNLAGAEVTGILYGTGTVDQKVLADTATGDQKAQVAVKESTLNLIGENTLSLVNGASKIQKYDEVYAKAGSVTKVTGLNNETALIDADGGTVTVEDGAYLDISELESGFEEGGANTANKYKVVTGANKDGSTFWDDSDFIYDRMDGIFAVVDKEAGDGNFNVTYETVNEDNADEAAQSMADALDAGSASNLIQQGMRDGWKNISVGGKEYFDDWQNHKDSNAAFRRGMMIGEDAAVTGNTVSIARDMADNVMQRLSFTDDYVQDNGWVNNDGGIWAKYIHRKYETDNMGSSVGGIHSSTDYDGAIVGVDFAKHGNFQSGVAFHYGSGDGNGLISRNDYDAWGFTLYGSLKDEEAGTNLMADIGYVTSDNDIDGTVAGKSLSADRDVDAWTIGLRGEKGYVFGKNQLVPYVGLRYMSVNPARYTAYYNGKAAFDYDADNQNLWLLPIGVSFRNETVTDGGWRITPKLDLSYIWAFGDTDTDMTVNAGTYSTALYYDVMDDNSWLASLGVEATKDVWSFGVGYGYQKGDDTKNKTWFVNASYAF